MSNAAFNTEIDTMRQSAIHVRDVNQQIQGELSGLMSRLVPLFDQWKGEASVQFNALKERWNDDATKLNQTLYSISEAIDKTRENYATTDATNRQGFAGVTEKL